MEAKEEEIIEDLTTPSVVLDVTVIQDWEKRFRLAKYTNEQKRIVNLCLRKM